MSLRLRFDRGPLGECGSVFGSATQILVAQDASDITAVFDQLQNAHDCGKWIAGFATYELGFALCTKIKHLMPLNKTVPLCVFGVFDAPSVAASSVADPVKPVEVGALRWSPLWSEQEYTQAFNRVHAYIAAGDIYQANLTFPLVSHYSGSCDVLYEHLCQKQSVSHGAFVEWNNVILLSRSPELFFSLSAQGQLQAKPMKGTAPRGANFHEDHRLANELYNSAKNRAENMMIVDLLRNDMSRISQVGSVRVPQLFEIERYETVHQMTSTITSQIDPESSIYSVFKALFPCGSIVGAPKIRAMEILHELEPSPRGPYCGSIGWIAPSGEMAFNVAIRTLVHERETQKLTLQVGGGVVYDSTAKSEYKEALLKSHFAHVKSS